MKKVVIASAMFAGLASPAYAQGVNTAFNAIIAAGGGVTIGQTFGNPTTTSAQTGSGFTLPGGGSVITGRGTGFAAGFGGGLSGGINGNIGNAVGAGAVGGGFATSTSLSNVGAFTNGGNGTATHTTRSRSTSIGGGIGAGGTIGIATQPPVLVPLLTAKGGSF